jgi:glutamine cyclotransferase
MTGGGAPCALHPCLAAAGLAALWLVCAHAAHAGAEPPVACYGYRVVHVYPHDPQAFTQGLAFAAGELFESTGRYGVSDLRRVDLDSGTVLQRRPLPDNLFGEGIAVWGGRIVQLTWRSRMGFVYDRRSFEVLRTFRYRTEGWGITYDGHRLVMSDGSSTLHLLDPDTLEVLEDLVVEDRGTSVPNLNELEFVNGEIWANIWRSDWIARISPRTGAVAAWIDLSDLLPARDRRRADVLNGIAYDAQGDRLFVTGKLWPKLFEIKPTPTSACHGIPTIPRRR